MVIDMDFFALLTLIGGLALFLYGMKTMGDALSKLAGGKLEHILEHMTNHPLKAVALGAAVTAVIQSSSATTVMVVGFVNSGIMKLSQAVGVIMGANIGTTITSWVLSLSGIDGSSFFIRMLKPSSFTPILAAVGVIFLLFLKNDKKNDIGTILLGFAVLMFGMEMMSGAVKPLADVPEFTRLFTLFENPVLGMIVGAVLTAVIQSSSASVGILQAICATGSVSIGAAIPIILGQNIGTCVTALLSGVGAGRNARRASLVHLYFNLIGTVSFMIIFYTMNFFLHFTFLKNAAGAGTIAFFHSLFNIGATLLLLPLSKGIEKLTYIALPLTKEETETEKTGQENNLLDERFLEQPAFAVAQCKSALCEIAQLVEEAMALSVQAAEKYNKNAVARIIQIEDIVDGKEDELDSYLTKIASKPLSETNSKLVNKFAKCTAEFERISDYLKGIAYMLQKMNDKKKQFSKKAASEQELIFRATNEIVENAVSCLIHEDKEVADRIGPLAEVISSLKDQIRKNHNKRLEKGKCSIELGMALIDIVNSLERIAKHCSNIAKEEIAVEKEKFELHRLTRITKENSDFHRKQVMLYQDKYSLL